jgi:hypothetical protein
MLIRNLIMTIEKRIKGEICYNITSGTPNLIEPKIYMNENRL